ncbi:MAG: hypothetical protein JO180_06340 [Gemmatirosa sp.]|nr:hypothetical protein [Gemmatirosa sp.]
MSDDASPAKGLSKEAWGAITAITVAVISGAVTLAVHLWQPSKGASSPAPGASSGSASVNADAIAGRWAGTAAGSDGHAFTVEAEIAPGCTPAARCGIISVSNLPCFGALYLYTIAGDDYEFRVDDFTKSSAKACTSGAGEHFRRLPDGTLQYTTNYGPRGVLTKR